MPPTVLIVEDTQSLAMMYQSYLLPTGVNTLVASDGATAIAIINKVQPDLIVLDVMLPDMNGLDILATFDPENCPQVVVLTGHATKEIAIQSIKLGACDFLEKPIEADRFRITVNNALKIKNLKQTVSQYKNKYENGKYFDLIGSSKQMQSVYQIISSASASKATAFITGESGTGKELCARAVHQASNRADKPFVALNCAAIPKDLIESEIFGHLKGAFTGAIANRVGAAGQADGGTLFLDELCEMDINLQSKLLRFIQTGSYQQVGSEKVVKVDVRFVCATNRDPLVEVESGRFREDLYYRLHVIPIELPPLRERGQDIIEIAEALFVKIAKDEGHPYKGMAGGVKQLLMQYSWPGNVRQLENVIRNVLVLHPEAFIDIDMLPALPENSKKAIEPAPMSLQTKPANILIDDLPNTQNDVKALWLAEKEYIERVIKICSSNIPKAASLLDVSPSTLYRKIKSWEENE
ncbi:MULTISPECIES: sigma-54-dependent transcriptional regulator [Pseudoalteromonas]|uniref:Fis family transcriptional regulator n=1 Tax=Pseudoalteromonas fuliginea TaxID=1872678 RepID=A0ABD3Y6V6_9GAMM|nr:MULTISPECIES: sigma-54 dependent transcriptional regulator [Pseudoalteromonas]ALQ07893.1 Fis family transcriptional regulator [Pseudoalteromonas sp. Bsw20308]KDC50142.1 Fis family transcriptional regulator [Pseudoalteromonas fuliginea]KDC55919.1 Fis family transcriptional regulator [Pseudoalteromonas sp. S3431]KJZ27246.1 Fis family transcriptional regulator [Pseudoalteromonas fuliginea]